MYEWAGRLTIDGKLLSVVLETLFKERLRDAHACLMSDDVSFSAIPWALTCISDEYINFPKVIDDFLDGLFNLLGIRY